MLPTPNTYVDVVLPIPLPQLFTYELPKQLEEEVAIGKRVIVSFGQKRIYAALIKNIHHQKPTYKTKSVLEVIDDNPLISSDMFEFWEWIADYYLCSLGEVMKAAVPAGFRLESETRLLVNLEFSEPVSDSESLILEVVDKEPFITIDKLISSISGNTTVALIKKLIDKKALMAEETIKESYKPKMEEYIHIYPQYLTEQGFNLIIEQLQKAPKQQQLVMSYLKLIDFPRNITPLPILKKLLVKESESTSSALKELCRKNVFFITEQQVDRYIPLQKEELKIFPLSEHQQQAIDDIRRQFKQFPAVLLHGVTSSGKTEIYIHLIQEQINQGKQVLYLLPEIALTAQIIVRLRNAFGDIVGIYHSKFSDAERIETWNNFQSGKFKIILGVRSSIFLPFQNLGLIIVDEEHENTYKQYDPAPRYHARDMAIYLAGRHHANVLLGTATPSVETYFNAKAKRYGLVELTQRHKDIQLPRILIANILEERRRKKMKSIFTSLLLDKIKEAIDQKEQVILFQNRRGFSPFIECTTCGWVPNCKQCDVSMTYHKSTNQLVCHYCGYSVKNPTSCHACGSHTLETRGFGTEKIEDEIQLLMPGIRTERMDLDTTRTRKSYEQIIDRFENHQIDILIGTQMVSKGLNFQNVSLVGILNADNMLNYPDFRAFERSYHLMAQVSGRAGRDKKQGTVVIQTSVPDHYVLKCVIDNDYTALFNSQIIERKEYKYPPFYRLTRITVKHKEEQIADDFANLLATELKKRHHDLILGPQAPIVSRVQNYYIRQIMIKFERSNLIKELKHQMKETIVQLQMNNPYKTVNITIDIDPY